MPFVSFSPSCLSFYLACYDYVFSFWLPCSGYVFVLWVAVPYFILLLRVNRSLCCSPAVLCLRLFLLSLFLFFLPPSFSLCSFRYLLLCWLHKAGLIKCGVKAKRGSFRHVCKSSYRRPVRLAFLICLLSSTISGRPRTIRGYALLQ